MNILMRFKVPSYDVQSANWLFNLRVAGIFQSNTSSTIFLLSYWSGFLLSDKTRINNNKNPKNQSGTTKKKLFESSSSSSSRLYNNKRRLEKTK